MHEKITRPPIIIQNGRLRDTTELPPNWKPLFELKAKPHPQIPVKPRPRLIIGPRRRGKLRSRKIPDGTIWAEIGPHKLRLIRWGWDEPSPIPPQGIAPRSCSCRPQDIDRGGCGGCGGCDGGGAGAGGCGCDTGGAAGAGADAGAAAGAADTGAADTGTGGIGCGQGGGCDFGCGTADTGAAAAGTADTGTGGGIGCGQGGGCDFGCGTDTGSGVGCGQGGGCDFGCGTDTGGGIGCGQGGGCDFGCGTEAGVGCGMGGGCDFGCNPGESDFGAPGFGAPGFGAFGQQEEEPADIPATATYAMGQLSPQGVAPGVLGPGHPGYSSDQAQAQNSVAAAGQAYGVGSIGQQAAINDAIAASPQASALAAQGQLTAATEAALGANVTFGGPQGFASPEFGSGGTGPGPGIQVPLGTRDIGALLAAQEAQQQSQAEFAPDMGQGPGIDFAQFPFGQDQQGQDQQQAAADFVPFQDFQAQEPTQQFAAAQPQDFQSFDTGPTSLAPPTEGTPIAAGGGGGGFGGGFIGGDFNIPSDAGAGATLAGLFGGLGGVGGQQYAAYDPGIASDVGGGPFGTFQTGPAQPPGMEYMGGPGSLAYMGAGGILPDVGTQAARAQEIYPGGTQPEPSDQAEPPTAAGAAAGAADTRTDEQIRADLAAELAPSLASEQGVDEAGFIAAANQAGGAPSAADEIRADQLYLGTPRTELTGTGTEPPGTPSDIGGRVGGGPADFSMIPLGDISQPEFGGEPGGGPSDIGGYIGQGPADMPPAPPPQVAVTPSEPFFPAVGPTLIEPGQGGPYQRAPSGPNDFITIPSLNDPIFQQRSPIIGEPLDPISYTPAGQPIPPGTLLPGRAGPESFGLAPGLQIDPTTPEGQALISELRSGAVTPADLQINDPGIMQPIPEGGQTSRGQEFQWPGTQQLPGGETLYGTPGGQPIAATTGQPLTDFTGPFAPLAGPEGQAATGLSGGLVITPQDFANFLSGLTPGAPGLSPLTGFGEPVVPMSPTTAPFGDRFGFEGAQTPFGGGFGLPFGGFAPELRGGVGPAPTTNQIVAQDFGALGTTQGTRGSETNINAPTAAAPPTAAELGGGAGADTGWGVFGFIPSVPSNLGQPGGLLGVIPGPGPTDFAQRFGGPYAPLQADPLTGAPVNRDITSNELAVLDAERQMAIRGDIPGPTTAYTLPSPNEVYRGIPPFSTQATEPMTPAERIATGTVPLSEIGIPNQEAPPGWLAGAQIQAPPAGAFPDAFGQRFPGTDTFAPTPPPATPDWLQGAMIQAPPQGLGMSQFPLSPIQGGPPDWLANAQLQAQGGEFPTIGYPIPGGSVIPGAVQALPPLTPDEYSQVTSPYPMGPLQTFGAPYMDPRAIQATSDMQAPPFAQNLNPPAQPTPPAPGVFTPGSPSIPDFPGGVPLPSPRPEGAQPPLMEPTAPSLPRGPSLDDLRVAPYMDPRTPEQIAQPAIAPNVPLPPERPLNAPGVTSPVPPDRAPYESQPPVAPGQIQPPSTTETQIATQTPVTVIPTQVGNLPVSVVQLADSIKTSGGGGSVMDHLGPGGGGSAAPRVTNDEMVQMLIRKARMGDQAAIAQLKLLGILLQQQSPTMAANASFM